jgi:hypothetical protein
MSVMKTACLCMEELHNRFGGRIRYAMLDFWRLQ